MREIYLSPQTVGEIEAEDSWLQSFFIFHWQRIIGFWYSISSEEKPQLILRSPKNELNNKNTTFWKAIIREILQSKNEGEIQEREIFDFLEMDVIQMPYKLGKKILSYHQKLRTDLVI